MTANSDIYEGMYIPKGELDNTQCYDMLDSVTKQVPSCSLTFGMRLACWLTYSG